jgi:hypothetical protein
MSCVYFKTRATVQYAVDLLGAPWVRVVGTVDPRGVLYGLPTLDHCSYSHLVAHVDGCKLLQGPPITSYWTGLLILDHLYLVGNLTNSKIAETKALEPLKS